MKPRESFVGEAIRPEAGSFATEAMAAGQPGVPRRFRWQERTLEVKEVLETWKDTGDCRHGSGERYVRRHWFRIRTEDGSVMKIYFERQARSRSRERWRLYSLESETFLR